MLSATLAVLISLNSVARPAEEGLDSSGHRLWMSNAWNEWVPDATAARTYADAARFRGLNGVGLTIPWADIEPAPGQFDFSWIDERLDILVNAGLRVHLRLNCSRSRPDWFQPELMCTPDGKPYRHPHGFTQISFNDSRTLEAIPRAMGAVAAHVWPRYEDRQPHPLTSLHCMFSPPLEWEFVTDEWSDFGPEAQRAFQEWLRARYDGLEPLNRTWNTRFGIGDQITLQAAPRFDFQQFRTETLARLIDACAEAVHRTAGARIAVQFGSIWDGLSPFRGTRDLPRLVRNVDWVIVDDSPVFNFAFSMDYLRGLAPDKIRVNEIDGPWNPYLTNEKAVEQGLVSLERGTHALWAANWTPEGLRDPKWTFWDPVRKALAAPRPDVRPTRAILVSLATLYNQDAGGDVLSLVADLYNALSRNGAEPVDFINDTIILEHPEFLAGYTEGIHVPGSMVWMTDSLVEALEKVEQPVIVENSRAGSLDPYGKPRGSWIDSLR